MPGFQELIVIAVVALLVFGPDRLPELARNAGRALARFRAETRRNVDELRRNADVADLEQELQALRRELRDTRSDVSRGMRDMAGLGDAGQARADAGTIPLDAPTNGSPRPPAGAADARIPARADDQPPPTDPEAT